jgi:hypothetical protein
MEARGLYSEMVNRQMEFQAEMPNIAGVE